MMNLSVFRLLLCLSLLALCAAQSITVFDGSYLWGSLSNSDAHEHMSVLAALGGIVNRHEPRLFVSGTDADSSWLSYLSGAGMWLENATVTHESSIVNLVTSFKDEIEGAILYDGGVPSTSNVAGTIAGLTDTLPLLAGGSLYNALCDSASGPQLAVMDSLAGKFDGSTTGSRKNDAYAWFMENYMQSHGNVQTKHALNTAVQGYFMDYWWALHSDAGADRKNVAVLNADWVIANHGLLWDLGVWPDEVSNDDADCTTPGVDYSTLNSLLRLSYDRLNDPSSTMIHIAGFTPWAFKYLTDAHDGVATEWQTVKITSAYNAYIDADACCELNTFANAAFYQHYPSMAQTRRLQEQQQLGFNATLAAKSKESFSQNPIPTVDDLKQKGYVDSGGKVVVQNYISFYVGDYDSAAWAFNALKSKWEDPNRGQVPLGWAVNPVLSIRFPPIFDLMYSSLSPNDRVITGDSGAGYINPTQLFRPRDSGLPSGDSVWTDHCVAYYQRYDLTFTGFIINGASGHMTDEAEDMYVSFSPHGGVEQQGYAPSGQSGVHFAGRGGSMPLFTESDIPSDAQAAANVILDEYYRDNSDSTPQFHVYRSILQSPSYHLDVVNKVHAQEPSRIVVVDPIELSMLASLAK